MRKNDIALHISIGLACLAILSLFIQISQSILAAISIATLLFTIAQTIDAHLGSAFDDTKESMDVMKQFGSIEMSDEEYAFWKVVLKYDESNKKKGIRWISAALNCLAFAVLFIGLVVPITIPENIGAAVAILSAALLFFSLWLLEKQKRRKEQWEELKMLGLAMHHKDNTEPEETEATHD